MKPAVQAPFSWPVRVYYEDTDTGGVVFYANYLKFFERARTEWLRSGGIDQSALAQSHGRIFVVVHTAVDYHAPAKLDNELKLTVVVERCGRASVEFVQQAWRLDRTARGPAAGGIDPAAAGDTLLATGRIRIACVDQQTLAPRPMPAEVLAFVRAHIADGCP